MVSPLRSAPVGAPSALQALHPIVCARTPAGCWHRVRAMRRLQLKREWVSVARVRLDSRKSMRPFKGDNLRRSLLSAPRTDPYGPNSGIRLPPWVCDGKAFFVRVLPYALQRL